MMPVMSTTNVIKSLLKGFGQKNIGCSTLQFSRSTLGINFLNHGHFHYKEYILLSSKRHCTTESSDNIQSPLEMFRDDTMENVVPRSLRLGGMPHQVFIVHPYIKWGPKKKQDTSPDLQLEEAVSLIKSLHDWKVVETKKISLLSFDKQTFFNKGQLESLENVVKQNHLISSVFINIKSLRLDQHLLLEKLFGVPVFDRYSIVINIFKKHAITKEAKLQVSFAEIPYVRSRIKGVNEMESENFIKDSGIGSGESYLSKRLKALSFYEQQIKRSIDKLRKTRELLRKKRRSLGFPVVAVVGYTNAGKTSLIKCLTEQEKLKPENKLFATLDVTVHAGVLPCNMKVLYVDTIGFISDLPTNLLEPFVATLEDALQADVIVHVQDISHPDYIMQKTQVLKTLEILNLRDDVKENIISVGNKHDKLSTVNSGDRDLTLVSCLKQTGIDELENEIEKGVIKALQLLRVKVRVENGGREYFWLHKEAAISGCVIDDNNQQYVILEIIISKANLEKFKSYFIQK